MDIDLNLEKQEDNIKIDDFIKALDEKNVEGIKQLMKKYNKLIKNKKIDIVYDIYSEKSLTSDRLIFITEKCTKYLNISSNLVKKLFKDDNINLLDILFNNFELFDNEFILLLLICYKNQNPISTFDLNQQIEKYKFSFHKSDETIKNTNNNIRYLLYAIKIGNERVIKYLIKHGANIDGECCWYETPLFYAYHSGNEKIFKYLVENGVNINKCIVDETILFKACNDGNENLVKYLVEHGSDINKKNFL